MNYSIAWRNPVRGFALIEVLIAVVVLATGLLALTALQGSLTRVSADAKARSQVAAYASSEMDRIRAGGAVVASQSATSGGTDAISLSAKAAGLSSLSQTTTVTPYYVNASGDFTTTQPTGASVSFKKVALTLGWTDAIGGSRSMIFNSDLSPLTLSSSNVLVNRPPPSALGLRPIIRRETPVTDGMIPIALGNGEDTAATNPKPELVGSASNSYAADTRFNVLTYNTAGGLTDGFVRFDKQVETAFVGCKCTMGKGGFPTGGSNPNVNVLLKAQAYRPSYWDGTQYTEPKAAGDVVRSPDPDASQSELCDVCCRDHRDPAGEAGPKFNPWITSHDHYLDPAGSAVPETGSGRFLESCRVIRVNGLWRVSPDPRLDDVALLATKQDSRDGTPPFSGSSTAPGNNNRAISPLISATAGSATAAGGYVSYIYDYLKQKFYDKTSFDRLQLQQTKGLNAPDYVPIGVTDVDGYNDVAGTTDPDVRWLHARGLLGDNLEADAAARVDKAITECTGTTLVAQAQCVIPFLPIATVNVTELARWAGTTASDTGIDTTPFAGLTYNFARVMLNRFASAIARISAIGPLDDDNPLDDEQTFTLLSGISKNGTWLKVSSASGQFGQDPLKPTRGFATVAGPVKFSIVLNGFSCIDSNGKNTCTDKPKVGVGPTNYCDYPYSSCDADSAASIMLGLERYNRLLEPAKKDLTTTVCGTLNQQLKKCELHTFSSISIDGTAVAGASYSATDAGVPGKGTLSPALMVKDVSDTGYPSTITLNFTETVAPATPVCDATGTALVGWTCP
jgi:type IV pilus modification protein PilV